MTTTLAYDIVARDRASSTFGKIAKAAGFLGVAIGAAGIAQFIRESVSVEAQFSQTMASLQVNAGVGKDALGDLHDLAIQLGKDTVFSANEAAQAMLELSKGGMTAAQIQGGALASTLNLAATEGIDLDRSAVIMSQTLKTFGLNAQQSAAAVDMLAAGAVASTAGVEDLSAGLKYVGSTAKSLRVPMDDVVTALAELNNAGLDSTTAGTSLNRMMLGLSLTTPKAAEAAKDLGLKFDDVKGNMLPLEDVVARLSKAFDGMSTTERTRNLKAIFGVEGMRAANVLLDQGVKKWQKMNDEVNKTGVAQKMADARMSGTAGTLEKLRGSIETAQLALGERLAPTIQEVGDYLADNMVDGMNDALDATEDLWDASQPLVNVLKDLGEVVVDVGGFLNDLPGPLKQIGIEALIAAMVFPRLAAGVTSASLKLATFNTQATSGVAKLMMLAEGAKIAGGVGGMVLLSEGAQHANTSLGMLATVGGGAMLGFSLGGPIGGAIGAGAGALYGLKTATDASREAFHKSLKFQDAYRESLEQTTGAITEQTRELIYSNLQKDETLKITRMLGISDRDAVGFIMGRVGATRRVTEAVKAQTGSAKELADANGKSFFFNKQSASDFLNSLKLGERALTAEQRATMRQARAVTDLSDLYGKLPKKVVTALEQTGVDPTVRGIAKVAAKYDLLPKEIRSLIEAIGVDATVRDIQRVKDRFDALPNYKRIVIETHLTTTQDQGGGMGQRTGSGAAGGTGQRRTVNGQQGRMVGGGTDAMSIAQALRTVLDGARLQIVPGTQDQFYLLTGTGL